MSGRMDYAKAKRQGRRVDTTTERWNTAGWRTDYPDTFPVRRVRKARANSTCPFCSRMIIRGQQIASEDHGPFGHVEHFIRMKDGEEAS